MAHMVGADPAELDALGVRMTAAADRLESIRTGIGALLAHSHWHGRDADQFRHAWHHQLAPRLHNAATMTRAGATTVCANARQQREASGLGGPRSHGGPQPGRRRGWGIGNILGVMDNALGPLGLAALGAAAFRLLPEFARTARRFWMDNPVARKGVGLVEGMFKHVPGARGLNIVLRKLNPVTTVLDVVNFANEFRKDPTSASTFNAGVAVALGVAAKAPPLALLFGVASVAHGFATADPDPENQEQVRGATIKTLTEGLFPSVLYLRLVPTEAYVQGANAAERAIDTALGIRNGGLNGVPEGLR